MAKGLELARRKAIKVSEVSLVRTELLQPGKSLPLVVEPSVEAVDLVSLTANNRDVIEAQLLKHGAILFRGFAINSASEFEPFVKAVSAESLSYNDRATPRSHVGGNVYTSTEYPADQSIELHNECSYAYTWPMKIFFHCVTPSEKGGATPLADSRKVYERIDPRVRERLARKKIMYVRNFGGGIGPAWQDVFGSADPAQVEEYCRRNAIEFEWRGGDRLRTRQVRPAIARHPRTGEMVWFNQATAFHISTVQAEMSDLLLAELKEDVPKNAYYGDGTQIEPEVLEEIREAYTEHRIEFPWHRGDLLMLDNMLVAHGRAPFTGPRKILVAMADPFAWERL